MPRAKSPEAYPEFMHTLLDVMKVTEETKLEFDLPKAKAWHVRQNFYAYIKAWRHEEARLIKLGKMESAGHSAANAKYLMGWLCRVEDLNGQPTKAGGDPNQPTKLVFLDKSALPEFEDMTMKLLQYKAAAPALAPDIDPQEIEALKRLHTPAPSGKSIVDQFLDMTGTRVVLEDIDTSDMTQEELDALTQDPPIREPEKLDDLIPDKDTDQITPSNQGEPPTEQEYQRLMTEHLLKEKSEKKS